MTVDGSTLRAGIIKNSRGKQRAVIVQSVIAVIAVTVLHIHPELTTGIHLNIRRRRRSLY